MSLSAALHAAHSGLNAASRAALVVSDNVANATTPGFAPRSLATTSLVTGGTGTGVTVRGVVRHVDSILLAAQRDSAAADAAAQARAGFWRDIETLLGTADDPGSLSQRADRLGTALSDALLRPDSEARLENIAQAARSLANGLNAAEQGVQAQRLAADSMIARDVETLNDGLRRVAELNREITRQTLRGMSPNGLMDERQAIVGALAEIIPLRALPAAHGAIRLIGTGGTVLLDRNAASFGFSAASVISAQDSLASGWLSGLTLNGRALDTGPDGPLVGGRLAASFEIRDHLGPAQQTALDDLATATVARFAGPQADPTLAAGEAGLFTLSAPGIGPGDLTGIAGRVRLNPLADPQQGGALWRIRDGMGATQPGAVGETVVLAAMHAAYQTPLPATAGQARRDLPGDAAAVLAKAGITRQHAEGEQAFTRMRLSALDERLAADGVDTDFELQRLLQIEQAYAANARVIRAVDDMLRRLTEI